MSSLLRKLRGALGTALIWALGWGAIGFVVIAVLLLAVGSRDFYWETVIAFSLSSALSGLVAGATFSLVLGTLYRRRHLSELSPLRMALWGAAAALLVPLGTLAAADTVGLQLETGVVAGMVLTMSGLGAATAGGTVRLAQAADRGLGAPAGVASLDRGE